MLDAGIRSLKLNREYFENTQLDIELGNVTLIVGPNNSGKSQILRDIDNWLVSDRYTMKLLDSIDLVFPENEEEMEMLLKPFQIDRREEDDGDVKINIRRPDLRQDSSPYDEWINLRQHTEQARNKNTLHFRHQFTKFYSILLAGRQRFDIITPAAIGNLTTPGTNFLAAVYRNDDGRQTIREFVYGQFRSYLYFSPHDGHTLNLVLSDIPGLNEKDLGKENIRKLASSTPIFNFGDGVQCFVGLLLASHCYPFKIVLIDEPESYLHPPASKILGSHLSDVALQNKSSLIVATHSPDFLIGCLETAYHNMSIIRLTYDGKRGSASLLEAESIKKFNTDPLLRTTETLNALFHNSAIVCEADADKVFYSEINRRLNMIQEGIADTIFLNAQNKQTIHRIISPLRMAGIPAVGIFDLDVLNEEKLKNENTTLFRKILCSFCVPKDSIDTLDKERSDLETGINKFLVDIGKAGKGFSRLDRAVLSSDLDSRISDLLDKLGKYGIFIVPVGELEDWLSSSEIQNNTGIWLVDILHHIDDAKLQPGNDDVWKFIKEINNWIVDPRRLGMQN